MCSATGLRTPHQPPQGVLISHRALTIMRNIGKYISREADMTWKIGLDTVIDQTPKSPRYDAFDLYCTLPKDLTVVLYGAGQRGHEAYTFLTRMRPDIRIAAFIDSVTPGEKNGLPVLTPDALTHDNETDLVIICSAYSEQIIGVLKYLKIRSYLVFDTFIRLPEDFRKRHKRKFTAFRKALHTDQDKELFDLIVEYMSAYEPSVHRMDEYINKIKGYGFGTQYTDFINREAIRTVFDCGSFDGDTASLFLEVLPNIEKVYYMDAFDHEALIRERHPRLLQDPRAQYMQVGLSDKPGDMYGTAFDLFPAGSFVRDHATSGTNQPRVSCTTIDALIKDHGFLPPDLIKMDIENSELPALKGSVNTITSRRMQYAICLYHSEEQLVGVYDFLNRYCRDYVYRLGHYNPCHVYELVLYAIPRELYA